MSDITKSPRVYVPQDLTEGLGLMLEESIHHYLKNVMRVPEGGVARIFNGRDGEFIARIEQSGKKSTHVTIENKLRAQKIPQHKTHLLFAPIKKERMDWLVEKAVELGATDLHIVLTQNTDIRKVNEERMKAQIIEAAEQCERLDIPALQAPLDLWKALGAWNKDITIMAAIERMDSEPLCKLDGDRAILIGPSGGFDEEEKTRLSGMPFIKPVSLGENILRSETAAIAALSIFSLK